MRVMIQRLREMVCWRAIMRCRTPAIIIAASIVTAGSAAAQDRDPQWNQCVLYDEHGKLRAGTSPDLAIGACTAIIQSSQETAKGLAAAFLNRGRGYAGKREYDRAIQDYDQAIRLDPDNAPAFSGRGNAYIGKRDYDRAIQDLDQAIAFDPNYTFAFVNRGRAYAGKRVYDRAIQDFGQAIRLDSNNPAAFRLEKQRVRTS
jgi:tetratricopeptide (TPR) repeat protein